LSPHYKLLAHVEHICRWRAHIYTRSMYVHSYRHSHKVQPSHKVEPSCKAIAGRILELQTLIHTCVVRALLRMCTCIKDSAHYYVHARVRIGLRTLPLHVLLVVGVLRHSARTTSAVDWRAWAFQIPSFSDGDERLRCVRNPAAAAPA